MADLPLTPIRLVVRVLYTHAVTIMEGATGADTREEALTGAALLTHTSSAERLVLVLVALVPVCAALYFAWRMYKSITRCKDDVGVAKVAPIPTCPCPALT